MGLLVAFALLAVGYFGIGLLVAARLSAPVPGPVGPPPAGLTVAEVAFESTDGVPLSAWWAPPPGDGPERAVVLVHGWGGNRSDEHIRETAPLYEEAGYGVLMLDLRGHGESGGKRRTLGYREVRDVRGALAWLEGEGFEPDEVVLHGWSMGGATVVRSAPGTGVDAVVEEAGYADLPLLLRNSLPENSGLPRLFNPGTFLAAKLFLDFDPWAVRPRTDAARLREEGVPLFVIHSTADETVPYEHAKLFTKANPDAELWTLEGYEHVGAYEHPEYDARLGAFLDSVSERGRNTARRAG
ncbi:MAG: alpha/beta fold hydrolase [Actinomycetota bacterium]|nr:alpha/beta fold hydrolase [Actinomycetota bacterium]